MKFPVRAVDSVFADLDSPPPRRSAAQPVAATSAAAAHAAAIQLPTQEPKDDAEAAQQQWTVDRQDRP